MGRNELQSFQTLLQPRDQMSFSVCVCTRERERERWREEERGRGLKPRRISNKFTEKEKGERESKTDDV